MHYTDRLRNLREDADKSQSEIAALLGTTQQQYSRWESGATPLPIIHLYTLCLYYQISADYILGLPDSLPHSKSRISAPHGAR